MGSRPIHRRRRVWYAAAVISAIAIGDAVVNRNIGQQQAHEYFDPDQTDDLTRYPSLEAEGWSVEPSKCGEVDSAEVLPIIHRMGIEYPSTAERFVSRYSRVSMYNTKLEVAEIWGDHSYLGMFGRDKEGIPLIITSENMLSYSDGSQEILVGVHAPSDQELPDAAKLFEIIEASTE